MMKIKMGWALLFALFLVSACAHQSARGSVAMKISDREAHVCMGNQEVSPGDRVTFFKNECRREAGPPQEFSSTTCRKIYLGGGEVVRPLNEHYSVVRVDPGVKFEEGTVVEKGKLPASAKIAE